MSLAFLRWLLLIALQASPTTAPPTVLRIAADPNDLPFSNQRCEGYENKIAQLIADDLGMTIQYDWSAQRRGFFRDMLKHGPSDVVMSVPDNFERAEPTRPYMRSCYVIVSRASDHLNIDTLDDPKLRKLRIGVTLTGGNAAPPALALAHRGIIDNIVGYTVYRDYRLDNPTAEIVLAVGKGEADVAIVWGPLAGYFAKRSDVPLLVTPLKDEIDPSGVPLAFNISVGVKRGNKILRQKVDEAIVRHRTEIDKILVDYNVPHLQITEKPTGDPGKRQ